MSAVDDLYAFIEANTIAGGVTGWTLTRRRLLDAPPGAPNAGALDQQVVLTEDGGPQPEIPATNGVGDSAMRDIGVQVLARGKQWDGDASEAKALEVINALHGKTPITIGGTVYLRVVSQSGEPVFIGYDEQGRPRHTVSLLLLRAYQ